MKLFLIKIGKAAKIIQRDGFFNGGRRVLQYFLSVFKRVGAGDILFVTGGVGDSALYRTVHYAEELEANGFGCSITIQDNPFLTTYADKFKIFVFHRVLYTPRVKKMIEKIKLQKKEIIFETDDLVFDSKYLKNMDYLKNISSLEKKLYEKGVGEEILKDDYVKVCTTTTSYLAGKLEEYGKKVFIVLNKLSESDVKVAEDILKNKKDRNDGKIRLGYFSGTISHNKDFATITEALLEVMEKYPQVELFLAGPLDIESKLNKFKNRIKQVAYAPRSKHFQNIASIDINLSPLEIGNPFCEAKSELKFFEAGILGIPTVASATQTFKKAISDGIDGFVANDTKEWIEKLQKLILEPKLRLETGQKAREKALQKYTTQNAENEEFYSYLRSKLH
jgi:glycosyltransferase involved in cell wall biosynthesis